MDGCSDTHLNLVQFYSDFGFSGLEILVLLEYLQVSVLVPLEFLRVRFEFEYPFKYKKKRKIT